MNNNHIGSRFLYKLTADFAFLIHLAIVCIAVIGWAIPGIFYGYMILVAVVLFSSIFLGYCPLTRLEFGIRKKLNPTLLFDKSCIMHYFRKFRGLGPRPPVVSKVSFFKKHNFNFILSGFGILSIIFNLFIY